MNQWQRSVVYFFEASEESVSSQLWPGPWGSVFHSMFIVLLSQEGFELPGWMLESSVPVLLPGFAQEKFSTLYRLKYFPV